MLKNQTEAKLNALPESLDEVATEMESVEDVQMESKIYNITSKDDGITWGKECFRYSFLRFQI